MSNHPNRGPKGPAANPEPTQVKAARAATGLTQTQAAAVVYSTIKAWQTWEDGSRRMPPGLWELFNIKTGLDQQANTEREKIMAKELENLLDTIIKDHSELTSDAHRVWLAAIARGYRLMRRYGTKGGYDVPAPGPGFDEWLAGNDLYANAYNHIYEVVGNSESTMIDIVKRIKAVENGVVA